MELMAQPIHGQSVVRDDSSIRFEPFYAAVSPDSFTNRITDRIRDFAIGDGSVHFV